MKKNISTNINGLVFHIEEDGYEALRTYLDGIHSYFSSFDNNSEIVADIESRIAEIFTSRLKDSKQVITLIDVSFLIEKMGSIDDFKMANEAFASSEEGASSHQQQADTKGETLNNRKFYRDKDGKIIAGVCSGMGYYFNIDPVWPRILFVFLAVGSLGAVILVYIITWIMTPSSYQLEDLSDIKKVFRNPENKILGGVASGVAAFLGIDTALVRILFILCTFIGGAGFLTYIVLWMILPEAKSVKEKMQMQGEAITLSSIEASIREKFKNKSK